MDGSAPPVRTLRQRVGDVEVAVVTGDAPPACIDVTGAGVAALRISPDAVGFLQWLEGKPAELPQGPAVFIELGSGHGLIGLACAQLLPESLLVLTDVAELLPFAERSVAANEEQLQARTAMRPLPFGDAAALDAILAEFAPMAPSAAEEVAEGAGDDVAAAAVGVAPRRRVVALGAGIAYWECLHAPLAETLERLCAAGGEAIIGYFRRDWKEERRLWTKVLQQRGLKVEVLWEGEVQEPTNTASFAPTCSRDSGEWNARVYHVSRGMAAAAKPEANADQPWMAFEKGGNKKKGNADQPAAEGNADQPGKKKGGNKKKGK